MADDRPENDLLAGGRTQVERVEVGEGLVGRLARKAAEFDECSSDETVRRLATVWPSLEAWQYLDGADCEIGCTCQGDPMFRLALLLREARRAALTEAATVARKRAVKEREVKIAAVYPPPTIMVRDAVVRAAATLDECADAIEALRDA